jgi:release factor glutamine methyltransferase
MTDIRTGLAYGAARLAEAGIPNPRGEARLLLAHASGFPLETLIGYPERQICGEAAYRRLVERRAAREPLSHLTGKREFWSLDFAVTPDTLDPRADSESVVEAVLEHVPAADATLRILDLGTGTGCLLAALLVSLPNAFGIAVDRNPAAACVAQSNLARQGLAGRYAVAVGDWGQSVAGGFDVVVANPPYIPTRDIEGLEPEVAVWEPKMALDGGLDGLSALRRIVSDLPRLLVPGGLAALEFGLGQENAVTALAAEAGLVDAALRRDLGGRHRCILCRRPETGVIKS